MKICECSRNHRSYIHSKKVKENIFFDLPKISYDATDYTRKKKRNVYMLRRNSRVVVDSLSKRVLGLVKLWWVCFCRVLCIDLSIPMHKACIRTQVFDRFYIICRMSLFPIKILYLQLEDRSWNTFLTNILRTEKWLCHIWPNACVNF
jgi:hypothetical protein